MFENKVVSNILGQKWKEVKGDFREVPNDQLHDFYYSPI